MKLITLFIIPILLLSSCNSPVQETNAKELRHVVLFKFNDSASPDNVAQVEQAFAQLPQKIEEIKDFEWGLNNSPEGINKGFTHCYFLTFNTTAQRDAYLVHPDHLAFGNVLGPYLEDVLVVDYWKQ